MSTMRSVKFLGLSAAAWMACASVAMAASSTAGKLAHTWYYYDDPMMMDRAFPTFTLANGKVKGTDTCNNIFGTYVLTGKHGIRFRIASTRKMCPDMTYVAPFHAGMKAARSYEVKGDILTLRDRKGRAVMHMKAIKM